MNYDRNLIEKQIETYKNRINQTQLMELLEKSEHLNQILNSIREKLKNGGKPAFIGKLFQFIQLESLKKKYFFFYKVYLSNISTLPKKYADLAKQCQTAGDENKLMLHLKRKQIVENEVNLLIYLFFLCKIEIHKIYF